MGAERIEISTDILQAISSDQAFYYNIIPKKVNGTSITFYCGPKTDKTSLSLELKVLFGREIFLESMNEDQLQRNLATYYISNKVSTGNTANMLSQEGFLETIINEAYKINSSDIHIEASEEKGRVRLRVDGKLIERFNIRKEDYPALVNKIKILANLDISEKRLPQDGRISLKDKENIQDIRVSVIPSIYGEKVVLRLLKKSTTDISLEDLGMSAAQLEVYSSGVRRINGIVLISGPTGSGKTTTLYATLNLLNTMAVNILTIEDPVEYTINGVNQVNLRDDIGLSFSRALRTFLRQDPDIIMLGEIRDDETAQMAIRAALTGHLVLSTIHTNSAWGIITRLHDMGIQPFLLASTLNMAVAQRLVRKLCIHCRQEVEEEKQMKIPKTDFRMPQKYYQPVGCQACNFTGYSGRIAVFEIIEICEELREAIKIDRTEINEYIRAKQIPKLSVSAYDLFCRGETSLDEVFPILTTDY